MENLSQGRDLQGALLAEPWQYGTSLACSQNTTGPTNGVSETGCLAAVQACADSPGGGPLTRIWGRPLLPDGRPKPPRVWRHLGDTCFGAAVPGGNTVSMAMIVDAFHHTSWATLTLDVQPAGATTLVGLDTYFSASWSESGYAPGEVDAVDPATMFGYRVDIRPRLEGLVYQFGDGASLGPTLSPGGPYPDGDVVHAYARPGAYDARVAVTFGADFRINGGEWVPVPDTATVTQPVTTVTVREARAVLVTR